MDKVGNAGELVKGREELAGHDEAGAALGGTTPPFSREHKRPPQVREKHSKKDLQETNTAADCKGKKPVKTTREMVRKKGKQGFQENETSFSEGSYSMGHLWVHVCEKANQVPASGPKKRGIVGKISQLFRVLGGWNDFSTQHQSLKTGKESGNSPPPPAHKP